MPQVRSLGFAGSTVNVPHTEFREEGEKNSVTFDSDGFAEVSDRMAKALVNFYPSEIENMGEVTEEELEFRDETLSIAHDAEERAEARYDEQQSRTPQTPQLDEQRADEAEERTEAAAEEAAEADAEVTPAPKPKPKPRAKATK